MAEMPMLCNPSKRQNHQTFKSLKETSQYPNDIGQQLHSVLGIQFLQGLEAILVIPASIGYVTSSKTLSTTWTMVQSSQLRQIFEDQPPWHRFPSSRQHFSLAAEPGNTTCPPVTLGKGKKPSNWYHFKNFTNIFIIN